MNYAGYNQTATYWGNPVSNGYGGFTFDAPITLTVKWETRSEEFAIKPGEVLLSKAIVYVPRAVDVGGYLFEGTSVVADPNTLEDSWQIQGYREVPDLRNMSSERRAYL